MRQFPGLCCWCPGELCLPDSPWNPPPGSYGFLLTSQTTAFQSTGACVCVNACVVAPAEVTPSPSSAALRRAQRRATRVDNRYHSGQSHTSYLYYVCLSVCLSVSLFLCLCLCLTVFLFLFVSFTLQVIIYFYKIKKSVIL